MKELIPLLLCAALAAPAAAETFEIDPAHSSVSFRIRHLVGKVRGHFDKFSGTIDYEEGKPAASKVNASIDPASIDTANSMRDKHLRSGDFFDVEKCPKMEFASKKATQDKDGKGKLLGELTMHCVTKPVELDVELNGLGPGPKGELHLGATATGKIDRKEFGINWNKALDKGGLMLGDEVQIEIEIEAAAKPAAAPKAAKP